MASEIGETTAGSFTSAELRLVCHMGSVVRRRFDSKFLDELRTWDLFATQSHSEATLAYDRLERCHSQHL
jgi:hypothetical protein